MSKQLKILDNSDSDDEIISISNENENIDEKNKTNESKSEDVELKLNKSKKNSKRTLNEDDLLGKDGITRIYDEFPSQCKFKGRGNEAYDIKLLIDTYKEWSYRLHPGLSFSEVIHKCETLSSNSRIKATLMDLRNIERLRFINEINNV